MNTELTISKVVNPTVAAAVGTTLGMISVLRNTTLAVAVTTEVAAGTAFGLVSLGPILTGAIVGYAGYKLTQRLLK
jgi:hypothetical protein